MKLSRGPYKPRCWSLDPTDCGLTGPHCIFNGSRLKVRLMFKCGTFGSLLLFAQSFPKNAQLLIKDENDQNFELFWMRYLFWPNYTYLHGNQKQNIFSFASRSKAIYCFGIGLSLYYHPNSICSRCIILHTVKSCFDTSTIANSIFC